MGYDLFKSVKNIVDDFLYNNHLHFHLWKNAVFVIVGYIAVGLVWIMMFFFFRFHRKLVRENKTTIENIEHKEEPEYKSKYDISFDHNVEQVMGKNKWLWLLPIMPKHTVPKGQGIYFDKAYESENSSDDEEHQEEDNRPRNYAQNDPNSTSNNQEEPRRLAGTQNITSGINQQVNPNTQVREAGGAHAQRDRMTIHNEKVNIRENLNNIVRSENTGQVYKSSVSDENNAPVDSRVAGSQFVNKIDQDYEMK